MPWDFYRFIPRCGTFYLALECIICDAFERYPRLIIIFMFCNSSSKDGTLTVTRIKKVSGDQDAFIQELRATLEIPIPNNPVDDVIRVRTGGTIEVKGNHVRPVRTWLAGLGF